MVKKLVSLFVAVMLVFSSIPALAIGSAFNELLSTNAPTISVKDVQVNADATTAEVEVWIENNPGISSAKLNIHYDDEIKLTGVKFNSSFGAYVTAPEPYANPQPLSLISPLEDLTISGVFATLTFDISDVESGKEKVDISVVCDAENTFNGAFEEVTFATQNGQIIFKSADIAVEKIELDKTSVDLVKGQSQSLTATITPINATNKNITWSSSDEDVATVVDGVITAVNEGSATISATAGGKSATCTVSVTAVDDVKILTTSTESMVAIESPEKIDDANLYVAAYGGDIMIGVVSQTVDLAVGVNTFEVEPTWNEGSCEYAKVFLWNENNEPYAEQVLIMQPTIVVENTYADYSENIAKVNVKVMNNPGISSLKMDVAYDSELELTDIEFNNADFGAYVTAPEPYANPQSISLISPLNDVYAEGTLATLTFDTSNVSEGKSFADIFVTCDEENTFNGEFEEVAFNTVDGKIVFDNSVELMGDSENDSMSLMEIEPLTLTISEKVTMPGETVNVDVDISNNPGISSLKVDIAYDEVLTLQKVELSTAFGPYVTAPEPYANPQSISLISPLSDITANGTLATLTFLVAEGTEDGYEAKVSATYDEDNVFDGDLNLVEMVIVNGCVKVFDGIPGDINGDGKVNNQDAILHFRYVAGWNVTVVEKALDVTGDGKINNQDAILLFRYIAGWDVELTPPGKVCSHELTETAEKAETCTEDGNIQYWHCSKCNKYFKNAKATETVSLANTVIKATGHKEEILPAVNPTDTETGLTEGKKCSVCGTITVKQEIIPVLQKDEYSIQYVCDMVPLNSDGEPIELVPDTYKPTQTKVLKIPKMDTYKFLGWSDKDGNMYGTEIPKGTTGDLVLYANWASERNKAVPVKEMGDPIICEDSDNGQIMFVYEIGRIENIPLFETQDLLVANGLITSTGIVKQTSIEQSNAEEIGKTIANTTTNSSAWTFAEEWNETMSVSEEWAEEQGMTIEEAEAFCKSNTDTYNISNSSGGSASLVENDSSYFRTTENEAHKKETYDEEQRYAGFKIDGKLSNSTTASLGVNAGIKFPLKGAEASVGAEAGLSNTFAWEIGAGYEQNKFTKNITTGTDSWEKMTDEIQSQSSIATSEKTWNNTEVFETSKYASSTEEVSKAVSEIISQKNSKDSSYTTGGSKGENKEYAASKAQEDLYSSSVIYSNKTIEISERKFESTGNTYGAYRLVQVGMARVYAVVGYDIKNKAYYTYTYSVLDDDEYKEYLDYSYDRSFSDFESSVLPFEIPIFVNDYVNSRIASSKLQVTDDGIVTKYLGSADDKVVLIPSYYTRTNSTTGKTEMIKIKGIAPGLFKNNTNIVGISLGNFVNEIPESAFEGCTALKEVVCPNVVSIGAYAFEGCSSLSEFALPNEIEFIGEDAFDGIPALKSNAPTKEIAKAVANSNIQNITLDISNIEADDYSDLAFDVGSIDTFKLLGDSEKQYKGLSIKSDAKNTIISSINIPACDAIPIEVSSEKLTLERVSAHGDGIALLMKADETTLSIEGVSKMTSDSENSIVSKTINLECINEETYSVVETNGNVLVCGTVNNNDGYIAKDKIKIITQEEFDVYEKGVFNIQFDAYGGICDKDSITVYYNAKIGELPVPQRDYYTFAGWFTAKDGGKEYKDGDVYSEMKSITLYAHWTQNAVSDWVLASEVPEGAEIINNKWTYILTHYTTSNNSTMDGWEHYNTTSVWSDYGNWSNWQDEWVQGYDWREVGTQQVVVGYEQKTQYLYSRARSSSGKLAYGWKSGDCTIVEGTGWLDTRLEAQAEHSCGTAYGKGYPNEAGVVYPYIYWYNETTQQVNDYNRPIYKTQYRYRDRSLIYTYYFKRNDYLESTTYPTGDNISGITQWVQYRAK